MLTTLLSSGLSSILCMLCSIPGSVFSVSLHPSSELACSGGEDDKAFIWRVSDGSVVCECGGNDAVPFPDPWNGTCDRVDWKGSSCLH